MTCHHDNTGENSRASFLWPHLPSRERQGGVGATHASLLPFPGLRLCRRVSRGHRRRIHEQTRVSHPAPAPASGTPWGSPARVHAPWLVGLHAYATPYEGVDRINENGRRAAALADAAVILLNPLGAVGVGILRVPLQVDDAGLFGLEGPGLRHGGLHCGQGRESGGCVGK